MRNFEQGDVVRIPFPYTDRPTVQRRPGLVISLGGVGENRRFLWIAMITSAANRPWPGDVDLGDAYGEAGLPFPSIIRPCKIATVDARLADFLGRAGSDHLSAVLGELARYLGLGRELSQSFSFNEA